jgi:hypothetical protein
MRQNSNTFVILGGAWHPFPSSSAERGDDIPTSVILARVSIANEARGSSARVAEGTKTNKAPLAGRLEECGRLRRVSRWIPERASLRSRVRG